MSLKNDRGESIAGEESATYVNYYYSSIGRTLANAFTGNGPVSVERGLPLDRPRLNLSLIDDAHALKLIGKIKSNKSSCVKHVKTMVVKDVLRSKPMLLTRLVNASISHKSFPPAQKVACVTPLPKGGHLSRVFVLY